jgi:hypothetical protein
MLVLVLSNVLWGMVKHLPIMLCNVPSKPIRVSLGELGGMRHKGELGDAPNNINGLSARPDHSMTLRSEVT